MNYFEIFGLTIAYQIDEIILEKEYIRQQAAIHPDLHQDESLKYIAQKQILQINQAYNILKDPHLRLCYILKLHNVNPDTLKPDPAILEIVMEENCNITELKDDLQNKFDRYYADKLYQEAFATAGNILCLRRF